MKITNEDKQAVLTVLASNPKSTTHPTAYAEVRAKTGIHFGKLNAVKASLIEEGRIWEDMDGDNRRVLHLIAEDKRQQVIDMIKEEALSPRCWGLSTQNFAAHCRISPDAVNQILLSLHSDGLLLIETIKVLPPPQWMPAKEEGLDTAYRL